jgi:hypothetical protein
MIARNELGLGGLAKAGKGAIGRGERGAGGDVADEPGPEGFSLRGVPEWESVCYAGLLDLYDGSRSKGLGDRRE